MTSIEPLLAELPEPAPPPSLGANVMAQIARQPPRQAMVRHGASAIADRPSWMSALGGLVLTIALMLRGWWNAGLPLDLAASRVYAVMPMPVEGPAVLLLIIGLWLFLRGLFAPLHRRTSTVHRP
jgi:hypothetical protein